VQQPNRIQEAMLINEAVRILDQIFPTGLQQSYDRCGFQCGRTDRALTGILVGLDVNDELIEEALEQGCNLLVTHHPLLFDPLTQIGNSGRVERLVHRILEAGLAVYAAHTNADAMPETMSGALADALGLQNTRVLEPMKGILRQLVVYIPTDHADALRDALFQAGAGHLGNYGEASFGVLGRGTFKPLDGAQPFLGQVGQREEVEEWRMEFVFEAWKTPAILEAMTQAHPYQEVAYQLYPLEQKVSGYGMGLVGDLEQATEWAWWVIWNKKSLFKPPFNASKIFWAAPFDTAGHRRRPLRAVGYAESPCAGGLGPLCGRLRRLPEPICT